MNGEGMRSMPDEILVGFADALRAAGVPVSIDRVATFLLAVALVGFEDMHATYIAGQATLCASPHDVARYGPVFVAWFGLVGEPVSPGEEATTAFVFGLDEGSAEAEEETDVDLVSRSSASSDELLRLRDFASLDDSERRRVQELFASLRPIFPSRPSYRQRAWRRGSIDRAGTLRNTVRRFGEPAEVLWRRNERRPCRVLFLIDISGSMTPYADALLRFGHRYSVAAAHDNPRSRLVEVFAFGTRVTRLTPAFTGLDPDRALAAASRLVPDWSGGTRLGESMRTFLDRWGARGAARGAVVIFCTDGWERGDSTELGEQMARLHRLARRVVWVSPHRDKPGYEPVQKGAVAVLPHVDAFVAGHSLMAFERVCDAVART